MGNTTGWWCVPRTRAEGQQLQDCECKGIQRNAKPSEGACETKLASAMSALAHSSYVPDSQLD